MKFKKQLQLLLEVDRDTQNNEKHVNNGDVDAMEVKNAYDRQDANLQPKSKQAVVGRRNRMNNSGTNTSVGARDLESASSPGILTERSPRRVFDLLLEQENHLPPLAMLDSSGTKTDADSNQVSNIKVAKFSKKFGRLFPEIDKGKKLAYP